MPIYALNLVELETLKTYIKIYLKIGYIQYSISLTNASILFNKNPDNSFCLYINYRDLNNLIIKNWYPLSLIGKFLDWLSRAKQLILLHLISRYYQKII